LDPRYFGTPVLEYWNTGILEYSGSLDSLNSHRPTIGIDCRFAATQAGLGRYTRELTRALLRRNDPWEYTLFIPENSEALWKSETRNPKSEVRLVQVSYQHYSLAEQLLLHRLIRRSKIDLFHSLHFNVPLRCPVPYVVTIHDLTLHHYPNYAPLPKYLAYRFLMRKAVKHARHIIAISEFTKGDLLRQYPFLGVRYRTQKVPDPFYRYRTQKVPDPFYRYRTQKVPDPLSISVIPEGISSVFTPASRGQEEYLRDTWQLPQSCFIYVGNAKEHKNVQTLIDAFTRVRVLHHDSDPTLILVSHGKEVKCLRLTPYVRILENIEDMHLRALFTSAVAFVLPSLYEGLGLPCLEAMACGCPVIASNAASIPETCGDAALLVEPTVEGLSEAMLTILRMHPESRERKGIVEKGLQRAAAFQWERTAERTAEIYGELLAGSCKL
jgi:alpha-1,3-rhamnosyl/mannosyltransferase